MAKTATAEQVKTNVQEAPAGGAVALAEETPKSLASRGLSLEQWRVLKETIFPAAQSKEAIFMAIDYCKARNLDIFKKPVHIVPIWSKEHKRMVETVWPGISELRTTAARTGRYAGKSAPEWGPDKTEHLGDVAVTYPEYCRMTVYKMVGNNRVAYTSEVYWKETYATAGRDTTAPNAMWKKRPMGQLAKCAEAEALREAFPEEIGGEYSAEEMSGQMRDITPVDPGPADPRPARKDYEARKAEAMGSAEVIEPETYETKPSEWPYADPQGVIEEYPDAESFANAFLIDLQKMVKDGNTAEELRAFRDSNMESIEALRGPGGDQDASGLVWRNLNALKDGGKM
jgi:phage recombination protein Bet